MGSAAKVAPEGRKKRTFLRPSGATSIASLSIPTAYAAGSIFSPLRGSLPTACANRARQRIGVAPNNSSVIDARDAGPDGLGTLPMFAPVLPRTTPMSVGDTLPLALTSLNTV